MECSAGNPPISYSEITCNNCNCSIENAVIYCCSKEVHGKCKARYNAKVVNLTVIGQNGTNLASIGARCCHTTIGVGYMSVNWISGKERSNILSCNATQQRQKSQTPSYSSEHHRPVLNTSFQYTNHSSTRHPLYINDKTLSRLKMATEVGVGKTSALQPMTLPIPALIGFAVILGLIFLLVVAIDCSRRISKRRKRILVDYDNEQVILGNASESNAVSEYSIIDDIMSLPRQLPHFSDGLDVHPSPDVRHVALVCTNVCSEPGKINHLSSNPKGTINVNISDDINNDLMTKTSTDSPAKKSTAHKTCAIVDGDGYLASRDLSACERGTSSESFDNPYQSINDVDDSNESPVSNAKKVQDVNFHVLIKDQITDPERAARLKISDIFTSKSNKSDTSVKKSDYFLLEPTESEASVCFTGTCTRQESQYNSIEEIETENEISQIEMQLGHYHRLDSLQSELEIRPCPSEVHLITDVENYSSLEKSAEHQSITTITDDKNYFSLEKSAKHQYIPALTNDDNYFRLEKSAEYQTITAINNDGDYLSLENSVHLQSLSTITSDKNYFSLAKSAGYQSIATKTNGEKYFCLEKRRSMTFDTGQYDHLQRNNENTRDDFPGDLPFYIQDTNDNGLARTIYDSTKRDSAYFQLENTHPTSKSVVGRRLTCGEDEADYLTPTDVRHNPSNDIETLEQFHSDMSITTNMSNSDT